MALSRSIQTLITALDPTDPAPDALADLGAPDEVVAVAAACRTARAQWATVGRWEVTVAPGSIARTDLERAGAPDVLDAHAHFLMIGNDAGGQTAVIGWNPGERECVYVVDHEDDSVKTAGTLASWLVDLAILADEPGELEEAILGVRTERNAEAPADPKQWMPPAAVAAALKGGGHLGFASVGGCAVAIHKKGVRAMIGDKKKSRGVSKSNMRLFDVARDAVWLIEDPIGRWFVHRVGVPGLDVASLQYPSRITGVVALSSTHAAVAEGSSIVVVGHVGGELRVVGRYATSLTGNAFITGSRTGWLTVNHHADARTQLWRWDGVALRVQAGWVGNGGGVAEHDGELFGQRYDGGWVPVRMTLRDAQAAPRRGP